MIGISKSGGNQVDENDTECVVTSVAPVRALQLVFTKDG
jgi:hypothetical protein